MEQSTFEFNKEFVFGEMGAWISAPSVAFIVSQLTTSPETISLSAVIGAMAGASAAWLTTRIYHHKRRSIFSIRRLAEDIYFFTPVAFLLSLFIYSPIVYLISHYLLTHGDHVILAVIISQLTAFAVIITVINIYRMLLHKHIGKEL